MHARVFYAIDVAISELSMYSFALLLACVFAFGLYYYHCSNNVHLRDLVTDSGHACIIGRLRTELPVILYCLKNTSD